MKRIYKSLLLGLFTLIGMSLFVLLIYLAATHINLEKPLNIAIFFILFVSIGTAVDSYVFPTYDWQEPPR